MSMKKKILVVEDDDAIVKVIEVMLRLNDFDYEVVQDGKLGLDKALAENYDLVLLDLELPSMDGFAVCSSIREHDHFLPILMLTARREEIDRVSGLQLGADDYLCKPFSVPELTARIKSLLRRSEVMVEKRNERQAPVITIGELSIDPVKRVVNRGDVQLELTALEFDLLHFLAEHPGRPFTRTEILRSVWMVETDAYENNVNALIVRLRRNIEPDPTKPIYIQTVRGVGYRFVEPEEISKHLGKS